MDHIDTSNICICICSERGILIMVSLYIIRVHNNIQLHYTTSVTAVLRGHDLYNSIHVCGFHSLHHCLRQMHTPGCLRLR